MFRSRASWVRFRTRFKLQETRAFCSNHTKSSRSSTSNNSNELVSSVGNYDETYRQLDKLDFMTAAKILFTDPPKKKKFGIDFHLVQLFFACMPSLAVYLVAQYARYEMRKMEAELEQKKKREEEEKAKEEELNAREEKEKGSDPELQEVKVRLDKLEEAVKEIVVESKKQSGSDITKNQEDNSKKKQLAVTEPRDICDKSKSSSSAEKEQLSKQKSIVQTPPLNQGKTGTLTPILDASKWDQKGKNQNEGSSRNAG